MSKESEIKLENIIVLKVPIMPNTVLMVPPTIFAFNLFLAVFIIMTLTLAFDIGALALFTYPIMHLIWAAICSQEPHLENLTKCKLSTSSGGRNIPNEKELAMGLNP